MRLSPIVYGVALLLSAVTLAWTIDSELEAIVYYLRHPQEQFCSADFGKSENILYRIVIYVEARI